MNPAALQQIWCPADAAALAELAAQHETVRGEAVE